MDSYTCERGGTSPFADRVASAVHEKCSKYDDVVEALSLQFVVAVYVDFLTFVTLDECCEDRAKFRKAFDDWKALWAVVFFAEDDGRSVSIAGQPYGFVFARISSVVFVQTKGLPSALWTSMNS